MRHLFEGNIHSIKCENRYNTHFDTGIIVVLYRMSRPRHLHPDMEQSLRMRKSKLSSIIHTFSTALYQFATPFLNGVTLWHHQMPWVLSMVPSDGWLGLFTIKGPFILDSRNAMVLSSSL